jgi:hypothetical protein
MLKPITLIYPGCSMISSYRYYRYASKKFEQQCFLDLLIQDNFVLTWAHDHFIVSCITLQELHNIIKQDFEQNATKTIKTCYV